MVVKTQLSPKAAEAVMTTNARRNMAKCRIADLSPLVAARAFYNTGWPHNSIYSGRPTWSMSVLAVWIHRKVAGALVGYEPISD